MTDRGPPTFGGGKFPKQAISSVTHVVLPAKRDQNKGHQEAKEFRKVKSFWKKMIGCF